MTEKRKRLEEFILPCLTCVVCRGSQLKIDGDTLRCKRCRATYQIHNDIPIMTTTPARAFEFSPAVMVENNYPQQWLDIIDKAGGKPVLDMGSGNNPDALPNLIKLEIFAFPNVDVVGYGENLPFKDHTFHTVFSGAVIEHVQDPIKVVGNVRRVLQNEGEVHIETAFLQPVHAYPSHYYNMTKSGLEYLCSDFEKIDSGVKGHQAPSFTLNWILNSWQGKLEGEEKEAFLNATVGEIMAEFNENVFSKKWFSSFTDLDMEELACGVYFHGKKSAADGASLKAVWKTRIKNAVKCLLGRE